MVGISIIVGIKSFSIAVGLMSVVDLSRVFGRWLLGGLVQHLLHMQKKLVKSWEKQKIL